VPTVYSPSESGQTVTSLRPLVHLHHGRENVLNPRHLIRVIDEIERSAYLAGKTVLIDVPEVTRSFVGGRAPVGSD
jgi:hypothetical protein